MSDDDLENLLSNFTTPKLTHSSSTHPRDSTTSSNRVVLGSIQPDPHQLPAEPQAKARAQALQAKILEMSREDVDGGSEASSVFQQQVAALMRMRESDLRVIEALKKHIPVNSDSEFNPEVINELSTSVHMLTAKVNELLKKNRKYQKSHSSRSTRSSSSDGGSVYREEIDHLYYSYYHRDSAAERSKRVCT
ncbi:hypothetical protein EB796_000737 [Bugula neritina]|uniref:Uncharacterized protein n=1 Tax=Bugula neritina TaxID=10212 RepID=A0A7J7KS37_BUGNE|nr:hypothetical protein EB796_021058 [Bugula neritina]KAF6040958.1 hypothetical protein EB796_000737 [Bugula neritina]